MKTTYSLPAPRILIVDDNTAIHEDFRKIFGGRPSANSPLASIEEDLFDDSSKATQAGRFRVDFASQGQEALSMVEAAVKVDDPYAVAFVDVRMPPGWDGVETIDRLWKVCPDLQTVICTAYSDYSWQEILGKLSAADKLLILKKPFETVEVLQMVHALTRKWLLGRQERVQMEMLEQLVEDRARELCKEMEERLRTECALRVSEERFGAAFQSNPLPMAIQSWPEGRFLAINTSFALLSGHTSGQIFQNTSKELRLWENEADLDAELQSGGQIRNHPCVLLRADGAPRDVVLSTEPLTAGTEPCVLIIAQDVTEQLKLEAGLRQTQKMEVVGRMVASVTHEFTNVLAIIEGRAGLLQAELAKEDRSMKNIDHILEASQRATKFTRQLLGISRQRPLNFESVNLEGCAQRAKQLLEPSFNGRHEVKVAVADNLPMIRADQLNVEQTLINLILNAHDAMGDGGTITVSACAATLPKSHARRYDGARAGTFVCMAVSDSGCGIPPEIQDRIFDPFFTTKEVDKGTGLGLWIVKNTVKQHGGWVELVSEAGRGTTFKIFFPVWEELVPGETPEESELSESRLLLPNRATASVNPVELQMERAGAL